MLPISHQYCDHLNQDYLKERQPEKYKRPPKKYRERLLTGTIPVNNSLLTGNVRVNNFLLTGTVPVNKSLLTGTESLYIIPY